MNAIKNTKSICPECLKALDASIFEDGGKVYIKKECPEHGSFQELYWSDYDQYVRAEKLRCDGDGLNNPRTKTDKGIKAAPMTAAYAQSTNPTLLSQ